MSNLRSCKSPRKPESSHFRDHVNQVSVFSPSSQPSVSTRVLFPAPPPPTDVPQFSYFRLEDMGYLESQEISSHNFYLCHHRESIIEFVFHPFHLSWAGRLRSVGCNYREGHLHQHGFVTFYFTIDTSGSQ